MPALIDLLFSQAHCVCFATRLCYLIISIYHHSWLTLSDQFSLHRFTLKSHLNEISLPLNRSSDSIARNYLQEYYHNSFAPSDFSFGFWGVFFRIMIYFDRLFSEHELLIFPCYFERSYCQSLCIFTFSYIALACFTFILGKLSFWYFDFWSSLVFENGEHYLFHNDVTLRLRLFVFVLSYDLRMKWCLMSMPRAQIFLSRHTL